MVKITFGKKTLKSCLQNLIIWIVVTSYINVSFSFDFTVGNNYLMNCCANSSNSNDSVECLGPKMECFNCTCVCARKHEFDPIKNSCIKRNSIPEENCSFTTDCVDGLECKNNMCKCPGDCKFISEFGVCDCGAISMETPVLAIIMGVIISGISILMWIFCVIRTINNYRAHNLEMRTLNADGTTISTLSRIYRNHRRISSVRISPMG